MDSSELEKLLGDYRQAPLPEAPQNLSTKVWREIRVRQSAPWFSALEHIDFLAWFRGHLSYLAAPALALTLLVSVSWTAAINHPSPASNVQQALGLQVFSHQSSALTRLIP